MLIVAPFGRRDPKRREPGSISRIGISFAIKQQLRQQIVSELYGFSQRGVAVRVLCIHACAFIQQQRDDESIVLDRRRIKQCRNPGLVAGVGVCALRQQLCDVCCIAPVGFSDQRLIKLRLRRRLTAEDGFDLRSCLSSARRQVRHLGREGR